MSSGRVSSPSRWQAHGLWERERERVRKGKEKVCVRERVCERERKRGLVKPVDPFLPLGHRQEKRKKRKNKTMCYL